MVTQQHATKQVLRLAGGLGSKWGVGTGFDNLSLTISTRMRRTLARCYPRLRRVVLSQRVLALSSKQLREVACHELAHIAAYQLFGSRARPHGIEWQRLVSMAGYPPSPYSAVSSSRSMKQPKTRARGVVHVCPICQTRRFGVRSVPRWRCAECMAAGLSGELQIRRLPLNDRVG